MQGNNMSTSNTTERKRKISKSPSEPIKKIKRGTEHL